MYNQKKNSLKLVKFKKIESYNGKLIPFYINKFKSFKIKRFFILLGNKNFIRGNHAHKKCSQIFIPITGSARIEIISKNRKTFTLSQSTSKILIVPPMNWCRLKFLKKNSSLIVLCNMEYFEKEYIRDLNVFKKILK